MFIFFSPRTKISSFDILAQFYLRISLVSIFFLLHSLKTVPFCFVALISIRYYEVKEVAFSSHRFWQMTGILISYFLSKYACSKYVIFVSITTITMGTVVYLASEIRLRLKEQEMRHVQESHYKLQDVDGSTWIPTLNPWKQRQRSALVTLPQSKEW